MIAVDASAICAILFREPDSQRYERVLEAADGLVISPINLWEARVSASNRLAFGLQRVSTLVTEAAMSVVPVDLSITDSAFDAWRRYGKGRHPAGLNLGDCFAYALARSRDLPLLYKGDDFAKTDVASAL